MASATEKRLAEITAELKEMNEGTTDVELAHARADHLLIEALRLVWNQDVFATYQIEDIITAWGDVPKWYA